MIISIHTEKAFDKIQHPFMIQNNFVNLIKGIYEKATTASPHQDQ